MRGTVKLIFAARLALPLPRKSNKTCTRSAQIFLALWADFDSQVTPVDLQVKGITPAPQDCQTSILFTTPLFDELDAMLSIEIYR
jgi:hypothetical protein